MVEIAGSTWGGGGRVRNTVSVFLMGIGIAIVAIGFIAGLVLGKDAYGEFSIAIVFYWWLSALAAGFLFIGLSRSSICCRS